MRFRTFLSDATSHFQAWANTFDGNLRAALIVASVLCMWMPLEELSQLAFALLGAFTYMLFQGGARWTGKTRCQRAAEREHEQYRKSKHKYVKGSLNHPRNACVADAKLISKTSTIKPDVFQTSAMPVLAPTFDSSGFESEVDELVHQLTPSKDEIFGVEKLAQYAKEIIQVVLPQADVTGFVHGSLKRGAAFSVAVPEVDLVANVSPSMLARCIPQRARTGVQSIDAKKLQKSAIRACTEHLLSKGGMKFRRSAFRGHEPRVTLLVLPSLGFLPDAIPVDFSINTVMPLYTSQLLAESGKIEPLAKSLVLLVKRWAKDRGICHTAKGHLSPYMWGLLAIYFLQVRDDGALLPPLEGSATSFGHRLYSSTTGFSSTPKFKAAYKQSKSTGETCKQPLGRLFHDFVTFYSQRFDWHDEAVCIRLGRRAPPDPKLPRVVLDSSANKQTVALAIEDPFNTRANLSDCMNAVSLSRLHGELSRAVDLCERGASLTDLLTPWVPEAEDLVDRDEGCDREDCV